MYGSRYTRYNDDNSSDVRYSSRYDSTRDIRNQDYGRQEQTHKQPDDYRRDPKYQPTVNKAANGDHSAHRDHTNYGAYTQQYIERYTAPEQQQDRAYVADQSNAKN